jgi:FkbM family methyltransferase
MIRHLLAHPLNRHRPIAAVRDVVQWQIASRLAGGAIAVPFVEPTRLLVRRGMTGATGNIYSGLHEFEEMAFVLHFLAPGDLFLDVGANVGVYTVLAAGVCGAEVVAVEPVPSTRVSLHDNLRLNGLESRVRVVEAALGAHNGSVTISLDADTMNHVVTGNGSHAAASVVLTTVDTLFAKGRRPNLAKIDVEGYELEVLIGAEQALADPDLRAVLVEANDCGQRYGQASDSLDEELARHGFAPRRYDPWSRTLTANGASTTQHGNRLYVRDEDFVATRVRSAVRRCIKGQWL